MPDATRNAGPARGRFAPAAEWWGALAAGSLPGALAGVHLAGLIFFLNPELPFRPLPLLKGITAYGALLAAVSLALHLPFLWRRPERGWRVLPWGLTGALAVAAILDWTHASVFAYFLPPGINVRLIKTAIWLTVGALIAFYTALLHTVNRRRYGLRSRLAFWLLVLGSVYVMVERREAFEPPAESVPLPSMVEDSERPSLLVVGLEGATLDAVLPLTEQGRLPFLARVLRGGSYGRLESLSPRRWVALWTSLATGKYPYGHRVLGSSAYAADFLAPGARLELVPTGIGFRRWGVGDEIVRPPPDPAESLRLWQILPRLGVPAGVVGWPGSALPTAATKPQFVVSEHFFRTPGEEPTFPADVADRARLFELPAAEVDALLGPGLRRPVPEAVLGELARDAWRQSLTRMLVDQYQATEALFVHLPGLGEVSETYFGGYAAYQFEGERHRDFQRAADIVVAYYAVLDGFLAELWESRRRPAILAVVSAHGTEEATGLRRGLDTLAGGRPLAGYVDHSPDGVLLLYGDGIEPGALLTGARLVDVAPTLIYGLGLPVARDLDGRILMSAFTEGFLARHPLTFLPSYDTLRQQVTAPAAATGRPRPSG